MSATATMAAPVLSPDIDLELMNMDSVVSREAGEADPLLLRQRQKSAAEIDGLRKSKGQAKVASFYESQNEHIDNLLKPMDVHSAEARDAGAAAALKVKIAVNVSFAANICLAAIQLYAAISSMSLALFASCVDAVCGSLRARMILTPQLTRSRTCFSGRPTAPRNEQTRRNGPLEAPVSKRVSYSDAFS